MAVTKTIEIKVDAKDAEKNIDNLNKQFDNLGKEGVDAIKKIEKGVQNTEKNTKSLANGFKGVGLAIKAIGIGLVIEAFNILKELFSQNQKIADFFGTSIKTLAVVFNDFFSFIFDNATKVSDFFKDIFENPIENLKKLGQSIKENLIERFVSLIEVSGFLAKSLKSLFEGDFKAALDNIKEAGKEMVDVFTGVDDTTGKIGKLADEVGNYAKNVWNSAEALQAQENNAKLSVAQQQRLVEQYDRQAEKLRQIRDNDLISIAERQKANEQLGDVLNKQEKAMLGVAQAQIVQAQNQLALNKSIENQVELINAKANREAILAQIEGFRSEQIVNQQSLQKEAIELSNSELQAKTVLASQQALFEAQRKKDIEQRIILEREALEQNKVNELSALQIRIDSYKQGTQARLDAETEFALKKQELDNAIITKNDELLEFQENKRIADFQRQFENENMTYAMRFESLSAYNQAVMDAESLTADQRNELLRSSFEYEQILQNQRIALVSNTFGEISNILGEQTKAGKAFALAQALINTYQGISNVWAEKSESGFVGAGLAQRILTTAIVAAQGFKTVRSILKVNPKGSNSLSGGGGVGGGGAVANSAPQVNITGGNIANQIAEGIGTQQPVQAYVVANQVTTQQALDRNIVNSATLG